MNDFEQLDSTSIFDEDLNEDITLLTDEDLFSGKSAPKEPAPQSIIDVVAQHSTLNPLLELASKQAHDAQFPQSTALLIALTSFSATLGLNYCVAYPDGERLPIGIYFVGEQPPSSAKSRMLNFFNSPVLKAVAKLNKERYKNNKDADKEDAIPYIKVLGGNITPEALEQKHCNANDGYFSLASAEQGLLTTFLGLSRGKDRVNDNDLLLKGFNGEPHSSERVSRTGYAGNVHGSFLCIAQEGSINTILQQTNATGLAERFIFYVESHLLGTRNFIDHKTLIHESDVYEYEKAIAKIVNKLEGLPNKVPCFDELEVLELNKTSSKAINEFRQTLEPLMADGGKFSHGILRGIVGKIDMPIMKIAATLHGSFYILNSNYEEVPKFISHEWVKLAIKIMYVCLERVYKLLIDMNVIGLTAQEEAVLALFHSKAKALTEREIKQNRVKVKPFKDLSSDKSKAVEDTIFSLILKRELHQRIDPRTNKALYYV